VHRTDLVSFAFGLLFLSLAAWWLLAQVLGLVLPPVGWFLAGGLILIGVFGLVGALRTSRHGRTSADGAVPTEPSTDPAAPPAADLGSPTAFGPTDLDAPTAFGPTDPDSPTVSGLTDPESPTVFRPTAPDPPAGTWPDLAGDPATGTSPGRAETDDRPLGLPYGDDTSPTPPRGPAA
jgi:hypothetical protein